MKIVQMRQVIEQYGGELRSRNVIAERDGTTPMQHAAWMLDEMGEWDIEEKWEKVNRWLGFVQGILWMTGVYTIPQMADHNRSPEVV